MLPVDLDHQYETDPSLSEGVLIQLRLPDFPAPVEPERLSSFSIGITGEVHGAGSTTTAKILAQIFGFGYEYAGQTIRDMAVQQKFAKNPEDDEGIVKFNKEYVSQHPSIDAILDCHIITEALRGNCVFEGKAAVVLAKAHRLPIDDQESKTGWSLVDAQDCNTTTPIFSIILKCDEETAARRILLRKYLHGQNIDQSTLTYEQKKDIMNKLSPEEAEHQINTSKERMQTTRKSWEKLYHLSQLEKGEGQYDTHLDTTNLTPEQVVGTILSRLVANRQFYALLSDSTRTKIEGMFPGIQNSYPTL